MILWRLAGLITPATFGHTLETALRHPDLINVQVC
jgi:hypothetical protein